MRNPLDTSRDRELPPHRELRDPTPEESRDVWPRPPVPEQEGGLYVKCKNGGTRWISVEELMRDVERYPDGNGSPYRAVRPR